MSLKSTNKDLTIVESKVVYKLSNKFELPVYFPVLDYIELYVVWPVEDSIHELVN